MKRLVFLLFTAVFGLAAQQGVDLYTPQDLQAMGQQLAQKPSQFASRTLVQYGNHYTMLAERKETGSSELHEHEADIFVIESGSGTIVTGGKLVNAHTEKPGEMRGSSIAGGERHQLAVGDIIHIPAGTPHQILVDKGQLFTYFVIKVKDQ